MSSYMKEHDDFNYTKEKDEVERYLLRVIHRYFQVEDEYSKSQIESIIIEAIKRLKQWLVKDKGFIFSMNRRTGHLHVTIQDFNGEPVFEKRLAFNKDFGNIADTICEGDDPRLSDEREPNEHVHEIEDIQGLQDALDALIEARGFHVHKNKNVLDMLRYTGTAVEFDLIIIEYLEKSLEDYLKRIDYYATLLKGYYSNHIEKLTLIITEIIKIIDELRAIDYTAIDWLDEAKLYARTKAGTIKSKVLLYAMKCWTKESYDEIANYLKTAEWIIASGEFTLHNGSISLNKVVERTEPIVETTEGITGYSQQLVFRDDLTPEERAAIESNPISQRDGHDGYDFHKMNNGRDIRTTYSSDGIIGDGFSSRLYINGSVNYITGNSCVIDSNIQVNVSFKQINAAMIQVTYKLKNTSSSRNYNNLTIAGYGDVMIGADDSAAIVPIIEGGKTIGITMTSREAVDDGATLAYILQDFDSLIYGQYSTINSNWLAEPDEIEVYQSTDFDLGGGGGGAGDSGLAYRKKFDDFNPGEEVEFSCIFGIYIPDLMRWDNVPIYGPIETTTGTAERGYTDVDISEDMSKTVSVPSSVVITPGTSPISVTRGQTKLYLKYEDDSSNTIIEPLPVMKRFENRKVVVIQGCTAEDGTIYIKTNVKTVIPFCMDTYGIYNNTKLIGIINNPETYNDIISKCDGTNTELYKVSDDTELQTVINTIVNEENDYLIQGHVEPGNAGFTYLDCTSVTYMPINGIIFQGKNDNLAVKKQNGLFVHNINTDKVQNNRFIIQADLRTIKSLFHNARIYYEVKGK